MTNSSDPEFSAKAIYHLHSCPLRAWLFVHGLLVVNRHNPYIRSGDQRHERITSKKRSLPLGDFGKVDFSTAHQTGLVLHDITRSSEVDKAKLRQINYYLHAAREMYGIEATGVLHMADKKTKEIKYDKDAALKDIESLKQLTESSPPPAERIPICKGCTNRDWCFS